MTEHLRIGGTTIQYYFTCKRELWLYLNHIDPPQDDENITVGRLIHEQSSRQRGTKELEIGGAKLDVVRGGKNPLLVEIKKSSKLLTPTIRQLQYYMYLLEKQRIFLKAEISIPREKKRVQVQLDDLARREIEHALEEIPRMLTEDLPPYHKKPYCKGCAYRTFCEV